jgi:hypothetical protein
MSDSEAARRRVDEYLFSLAAALRALPGDQARDIVEEIRSHILDKATAGGDMTLAAADSALAALGGADELASRYVTDGGLPRAEGGRSPLLILGALLASLAGYLVGGALVACAFLKPIHPHTSGLWAIPRQGDYELSLRMGFGDAPAGGRELLGWWIVPVGLTVGIGLVLLATRLARRGIRGIRR